MCMCVYLRFWGELSVLIKILPATKVQGGDMAHWPKCSWLDRVYHHTNVTELQCPSALNHHTPTISTMFPQRPTGLVIGSLLPNIQ